MALQGDRPRIVLPIPLPMGGFNLAEKAGELPFTAIDRWATRHGIEGVEFELLHRLLRALDTEWLAMQAERLRDSVG